MIGLFVKEICANKQINKCALQIHMVNVRITPHIFALDNSSRVTGSHFFINSKCSVLELISTIPTESTSFPSHKTDIQQN